MMEKYPSGRRRIRMRLTLCLAFFLSCDGFYGSQMSKVSIQNDNPSRFIRGNILHSETISNRPSSSLQAKLPEVPSFQEQKKG
jgi:hypothetical protein